MFCRTLSVLASLLTASLIPAEAPQRSWKQLAAFQAHRGNLTGLQLSPDGKTMATAGTEGLVRLWDARTGKMKAQLQGHRQMVVGLRFAPDGKRLSSVAYDGSLIHWDLATNRAASSIRLPVRTPVAWAAFSPDCKLLATATAQNLMTGQQGPVQVWAADTGRVKASFAAHEFGSNHVAFSPDGQTILSLGSGLRKDAPVMDSFAELMVSEAKLWDLGTGKQMLNLSGGPGALVFLPDGKALLGTVHNKTLGGYQIELYDREGKKQRTFTGHGGTIVTLAVSGDGKTLVVGNVEKLVHVWDVESGKPIASLRGHPSFLSRVEVSGDSKLILSADSDGGVRIWETGN